MGRVRGPHSWVDDDFIDCDSNSKALLELDPWNPDMPQGDPSWRSLDESGTNTLEIEDAAATSWDVEDLRDDVLADQWDDISVDVEDWVEPDPTEDESPREFRRLGCLSQATMADSSSCR